MRVGRAALAVIAVLASFAAMLAGDKLGALYLALLALVVK